MLKVNVKASKITNLTDARYFAAWEVKWLGFNFEKGSEEYIDPPSMKAIKEWVEGVQFVGEFPFANAQDIQSAAQVLELDIVQVGMFTEVEVVEQLQDLNVIKEVVITSEMDEVNLENLLVQFAPHVTAFQLSFEKNGITWEMIKNGDAPITFSFLEKSCYRYPIILSLDLKADDLEEVLSLQNLYGINVKGGEEEKVGVKSFDELDEIFEALEVLV